MDYLSKVAEFHRQFNHPILPYPQLPPIERQNLRASLILEEARELSDAIMVGDLVAIADALADLQYVVSGAILEFGMSEAFSDLFDEVQNSNLSKSCDTEEEAVASQAYYEAKGVDTYYQKVGERYNIYRSSDHKSLKNVNWKEPKLEPILKTYIP